MIEKVGRILRSDSELELVNISLFIISNFEQHSLKALKLIWHSGKRFRETAAH